MKSTPVFVPLFELMSESASRRWQLAVEMRGFLGKRDEDGFDVEWGNNGTK